MKKINDRTYKLWVRIFQISIIAMIVIFLAWLVIIPDWHDIQDYWHERNVQPVTKVSCTYDVTAQEKAAYVAGKTAAYQHMLATQCKKLNDTHPTQTQDCSKIDSSAVITDRQYEQNDEPQD